MQKKVQLLDLGSKDYKETWEVQEKLFQGIVDIKIENRKNNTELSTPNYFIFVEHPHVYTLGKSGDISNLLLNEEQLSQKGATFYKINRGGDITYHGPGQIVGYPILDLDNFFTDIHKYLRFLEEVIIKTLEEYGIKSERSEGETGVWLDVGTPFARKICALGVRTSRWVTMHGFALNVTTNLGYFDNIIPCGIKGKAVTSLEAELDRKVPLEEVKGKILFIGNREAKTSKGGKEYFVQNMVIETLDQYPKKIAIEIGRLKEENLKYLKVGGVVTASINIESRASAADISLSTLTIALNKFILN